MIQIFSAASVSFLRLDGFLNTEEMPSRPEDPEMEVGSVRINGEEYRWDPDSENPCLSDVYLEIKTGELGVIVGSVGSGKSSLMAAILGEMNTPADDIIESDGSNGAGAPSEKENPTESDEKVLPRQPSVPSRKGSTVSVITVESVTSSDNAPLTDEQIMEQEAQQLMKNFRATRGVVSYASQTPWLLNMTLRDNILFGNVFDKLRYDRVIDACGLKRDLESLPGGDQTEM